MCKLPSCSLNTLLTPSQISSIFRSVLSPDLEFVLRVKDLTSFSLPSWLTDCKCQYCPVCFAVVSPLLLHVASKGPACGLRAFVFFRLSVDQAALKCSSKDCWNVNMKLGTLLPPPPPPPPPPPKQQVCIAKLSMTSDIKRQACQLLGLQVSSHHSSVAYHAKSQVLQCTS